jgi:hypothetical protein
MPAISGENRELIAPRQPVCNRAENQVSWRLLEAQDMLRQLVIIVSTLILAAIGLAMGHTLHGNSWFALIPGLAGALGGTGIGLAGSDVWRRSRLSS